MNYQGKKVLVTGGAGFVGANLVERLLQEEAKVYVLDDLFTGKRKNLPDDKAVEFIHGSVTDFELVKKLAKEVEIIFHLAARNIIASTKDPRGDLQVNIGGTLNVLLATKETTNIKKIVYTSSASVYGNSRRLPTNEDEVQRTLSPYSVSKLGGENYCVAFYELYKLPTTILRYSNVYGPKQDPANPYSGVISKFIDGVNKNASVKVYGDGRQTRDFTYVDDVVEATILAGFSNKVDGEIFNVSTGRETSILETVKIFEEIYGKKIKVVHVEKRDIDNIRRRVLNIENIRTKLNWLPQTTLSDGLRKTIAWISKRENK